MKLSYKWIYALIGAATIGVSSFNAIASDSQPSENTERPHGPHPSFEDMDTNGDGLLMEEELKGPLARDLDKFDLDGNGGLDETELPQPPQGKGKRNNRTNSDN